MASVNWQKANVQTIGAMSKHNGKEERTKLNHSNTDIDKTKSHLNIYIGADDWSKMANKVAARVAEVDREHPPLKISDNRVTAFLLEIPVPKEVELQGNAKDFLFHAFRIFEEYFGAENVGGMVCHYDEQHTYVDTRNNEERVSLIHGHVPVAACLTWTEDVTRNEKQENGKYKKVKTGEKRERFGINGKNFSSKVRMQGLNRAIDDMCVELYNIHFLTGKHVKGKSVEELKTESRIAAIRKEHEELVAENDSIVSDNLKKLQENIVLDIENGDLVAKNNNLKAENAAIDKAIQSEWDKFNRGIANVRDQLDHSWDALQSGFDELDYEKAEFVKEKNEFIIEMQSRERTINERERIIAAAAQQPAETERKQRIAAIQSRAKPISLERAERLQRAAETAMERKIEHDNRINQAVKNNSRKTTSKDKYGER